MKIKWRQWKIIMTAVLGALLLTGCGLLSKENVKLRDLDFTVLSEEKIPEELKTVIAEKGTEPFQLTYSDNQNLYISIGYGEQKTGGYSIAVDALYLTDDAIHVSTSLLESNGALNRCTNGSRTQINRCNARQAALKTTHRGTRTIYDNNRIMTHHKNSVNKNT